MKGREFKCLMAGCMLCFCGAVNAQTAIFDVERLMQTIMNFSDEMTETIRQTGQIIDQVDKTKRIYDNWKKVADKLSVVSEYVGRVEDIEEVYSMMKRTVSTLAYGKDVILDGNYLNVSRKVGYLNNLVSMSTYNIDRLQYMLRKYTPGSKEGGNMDDGQREEQKIEDMAVTEGVIESMEDEIDAVKRKAEYEQYRKTSYCSAMSSLGGF